MKVVEITGAGQAAVVEEAEPFATDDIVKVQLRVIPMCTEFKGYAAGERTNRLGHEASGTVVDAVGLIVSVQETVSSSCHRTVVDDADIVQVGSTFTAPTSATSWPKQGRPMGLRHLPTLL